MTPSGRPRDIPSGPFVSVFWNSDEVAAPPHDWATCFDRQCPLSFAPFLSKQVAHVVEQEVGEATFDPGPVNFTTIKVN